MAFESAVAISPAARAARARPALVDRLLPKLFTLIVILMFTLSGGVLWNLGINYEGITGSAATKIHPATYLAALTCGFLLLALRNRLSFIAALITRNWGTLALFGATLFMAVYIVLGRRHGIATVFDTYLLTIMVSIIVTRLNDGEIWRTETLLHVLLAANAVLGIVEQLIDYRFFPYRFDGVPLWDSRSTALLGHPLNNAILTGAYVLILLGGGGRSLKPAMRFAMIVLQLVAMAAFGGRTAMAVVTFTVVLWMIPRALAFFSGRRMSLPAIAAAAFIVPVLIGGIAILAWAGFFDVFLARIGNDGGSANARVEMLAMFERFSWREILLGPATDLVDSMRQSDGLELGLENPIIRLILYQGAAVTAFLTVGFVLFLTELKQRLRPGTAMAIFFYAVVINSYESISNKTIMLAQFVVMMLILFHRPGEGASAAERSWPLAEGAGATARPRTALTRWLWPDRSGATGRR